MSKPPQEVIDRINDLGSQLGTSMTLDNLTKYDMPRELVSRARRELNEQKSNWLLKDSAKRRLELLSYYYPTRLQIAGRMVTEIGKDLGKVGRKTGKITNKGLAFLLKAGLFLGTAPIFGSLTEPLRKDIYDKMTEPMPWYDYESYQKDTNGFSFWSSVIASPIAYLYTANRLGLSEYQQGLALLYGVIESGLRTSYTYELRKPGNLIGTLASKGLRYLAKKYQNARWTR